MAHGSTVFTGSFAESGSLVASFSTVIPLFKLLFLGGFGILCQLGGGIVLCVPGLLLDKLGGVCLLSHQIVFSFKILLQIISVYK